MMPRLRFDLGMCLIVSALCLLMVGPLMAADYETDTLAEIQELQRTINSMQQRLGQLEEKLKASEPAKIPVQAKREAKSAPVNLDGYLQFRYQNSDAQSGKDEFFIRRLRLNVRSNVSDHVEARLQLRLDDKLTGKNNTSLFSLREGYIDYVFGASRFRAGQAVVPFGYEVQTSSSKLWAAERSFVVDRLFPDQVELGVQYHGPSFNSYPRYALGVLNGVARNEPEDNSGKAPVASYLVPIRDGSAIVSYYNGDNGIGVTSTERIRMGGGLKFDWKPLAFMGEYIAGKDLGEDVAGWYSQLGYHLHGSSMLFVKYDEYDENTNVPNDSFKRTTAGFFRDFTRNNRLTLAYEFRNVGEAFTEKNKFNGNAGYAQWQVIF
ncbi:MAG: porin [Armatimonadota bacterium]